MTTVVVVVVVMMAEIVVVIVLIIVHIIPIKNTKNNNFKKIFADNKMITVIMVLPI